MDTREERRARGERGGTLAREKNESQILSKKQLSKRYETIYKKIGNKIRN